MGKRARLALTLKKLREKKKDWVKKKLLSYKTPSSSGSYYLNK
jgi:hypothetical protein